MARAVFERERGNFIDLRPTKDEPASVLARVVTLVNLDANQMSLSRDEPIHPSNATFPTVTTTHARTVQWRSKILHVMFDLSYCCYIDFSFVTLELHITETLIFYMHNPT